MRDRQTLIAGIDISADVALLDSRSSGIEQIAKALGRSRETEKIEALHIVCHGEDGRVQLGNETLSSENIESYRSLLKKWNFSLSHQGKIIIYGCNVARSICGKEFVRRLSQLTGADIAASVDKTGNAELGGSWNLDYQTDKSETPLSFNLAFNRETRESYQYVLANFDVNVATDDGTGGTANTLSWAILQANQTAGDDTITLNTDVRLALSSSLKRMQTLINSNVTVIGNNHTISGDNNNNGIADTDGSDRPIFFIKSGTVAFQNMTLTGGVAQGGNAIGGGGGAGMGGGMFVYSGTVTVDNVTFNNNLAIGGSSSGGYRGGGGGMAGGGSGHYGGGGLFALSTGDSGAYGGNGNYGGFAGIGNRGAVGGFGGGGAKGLGRGGAGGFGGGGGHSNYGAGTLGNNRGEGGFGGGGSGAGFFTNGTGGYGGYGGGGGKSKGSRAPGPGGFGAGNGSRGGQGGGGAGLGGAIFIRSGSLTLKNATFTNNSTTGGTGFQNGQGKGGAIFIMQSTTNSNGNNQGMPATIPVVNATATFSGNAAADDAGSATDNDDVFGSFNNFPTAANNRVTTLEDTAYSFSAADFKFSDIDTSDSLQKIKITQLPSVGLLQLSGSNVTLNQEIAVADIAAGNLQFLAASDTSGNSYDNFQFQISDGQVYSLAAYRMTVDVTEVNDVPSFSNLGDQIFPSTTAVQAVAGWANTFDFGSNEGEQLVNDFIVSVGSNPNNIFATLPDVANDGTLSFTANGNPGTATVSVQLIDDGGTANGGIDTSSASSFNITVLPPEVNLSLSAASGSEEGGTTIIATVTASAPVVGNQTIDLVLTGTASSSDFSGAVPTQITIVDGTTTGQGTFVIANDNLDEEDETATVTLANPSAGIGLGTTSSQNFSITDDDTAGFELTGISGDTSEFGDRAAFNVKLTSEPTADVTIGIASSDASEGIVSAPSLTFTPSNWDSFQTVIATGVEDAIIDGSVAYQIITSADTATADTKYNGLEPADLSVINTDNDSPGVTIAQTGGTTLATEGGDTDVYSIQLNTLPAGNVEITLNPSSEVEASLDGINFASSQTLIFTPTNGMTAQTVMVRAIDDAVPSGERSGSITHAITATADGNYPTSFAVGAVNPIITDNDISYTLAATTASIAEGNINTTPIAFTIARAGAINESSSVDFNFGGTATFLADYTNLAVSGTGVSLAGNTIAFAPGATEAKISIEPIGDSVVEEDETIQVSLANGTATGTAIINAPASSPVTTVIANDDRAGFSVIPNGGLTTSEAGRTASFEVSLTSQPTAQVAIAISSDNPAEGIANQSSLTFDATNWNVPQTVTLVGIDDAVEDGNIPYNILLGNAVSTDSKYNGIDPADVSLINRDNDTAGITVTPTGGLTTTEAGGTASFEVSLNSQPLGEVAIAISSDNSAEGIADKTSLTFDATNWNVPQRVTVAGVDDASQDGSIAYNIVLANAVSTDAKYNGVNPADVSLTNNDNDTAGITINPTQGLTTSEAGGRASFEVVLNTQPTADVAIAIGSNAPTEGIVSVPSLTFTPSNWNIAQIATVTGVNDFSVDGDIDYRIITSPATSTDGNYNGINAADVQITNSDDDTAGAVIIPSNPRATEGGARGSYELVLASSPSAPVTIQFNTGSRIEAIQEIIFDSSNWNIPQTVAITALDNNSFEGERRETITHSSTSADANYNGIAIASIAVNIIDNEILPPPTPTPAVPGGQTNGQPGGQPVSSGITSIQPLGSTDLIEGAGLDIYKLILPKQPRADVVLNLSTDGAISLDRQTVTFTPSNWNIPQAIAVFAPDNNQASGNRTSAIAHTAASTDLEFDGLTIQVPVNIIDNDRVGEVISFAVSSQWAGTNNDDFLTGSSQDDNLQGRNGINVLDGRGGNDFLLGGADSDFIAGGSGSDQLYGGEGFDNLNGDDGDDLIFAGEGSDRLRGGSGNDLLFGDRGSDHLFGQAGADIFGIGIGTGGATIETADVIADFSDGEDQINLVGADFSELTIFQGSGAFALDTIIQHAPTGEYLARLANVAPSSISGNDFV
ncbi:MAG: DUF4347 domain-containing protein [Oscillatoria sp. SIO1A7]|nr:DUF4347 domain-containing protein [Oscillatoria sp. SIO1A7]